MNDKIIHSFLNKGNFRGKRKATHVINLLFQLGLGLGQSVDFVLLCLQVIQCLLVGLLKGFLFLGQLGNGLVLGGHLLSQVLNLE